MLEASDVLNVPDFYFTSSGSKAAILRLWRFVLTVVFSYGADNFTVSGGKFLFFLHQTNLADMDLSQKKL